jgi:predicted amidophosphoribosyltransferase
LKPAHLELRRHPWDGNHCFSLDYVPGARGVQDPRRLFIRAFKAGDLRAAPIAREILVHALSEQARSLARGGSRLLVPIPGHLPGPAGPPLDRLCRGLADSLPWLVYRPALLVRQRGIRQSCTSSSRPSTREHLDSLGWSGGRINGRVILVDDVFTYGHISGACWQVVADAGADGVTITCLALSQV